MDNKDFFDEEYDKVESKQVNSQTEKINQWYGQQPVQSKQSNGKKPLYIVLLCCALILCIVFGWVLCTVFGGGQSKEERLFSEVLSVLNKEYYKKVSDTKVWEGIEEAGTALLQTSGDQFSRLMSPATYYSYMHPQSSMGGDSGVFGMSFQIVEGIGLYVAAVTVNSNAYGVLEEGDLIVKISNINGGNGVNVDGVNYNEVNVGDVSSKFIQNILGLINSAEFSFLRGDIVKSQYIERGIIDYVNSEYPYEFVEFYFGDKFTNVSLTHGETGPQTSVYEERLLNRLSEIPDAGYVRIDQFMDTYTDNGKTTAASEFAKVMELFKAEVKDADGNVIKKPLKYLILDLKGNPGGSVEYVSEIAGMLITDSKLSAADKVKMRDGNKLLITTLEARALGSWNYTAVPAYEQYFGALNDNPNIVVWTDGGSASASELLTGALRDYGTAVQMGTTTYGKGIAQTIKELTDYKGTFLVDGKEVSYYWAVYYTVAEYFSPVTHTNIHGKGYTPAEQYNNLDSYDDLWTAAASYFKSVNNGSGGGILASK